MSLVTRTPLDKARGTENRFNVLRNTESAWISLSVGGESWRLTYADARNLAAWLVAMDPDPEIQEFSRILNSISK